MAQGIFEKMLGDKASYIVGSAGIFAHPDAKINPMAQKQLAKRGIDMHDRQSVQVTQQIIDDADLVLAMTASHHRFLVQSYPSSAEKIHLLGDYTNRADDVFDPYGGNDQTYDTCAKTIEDMLVILIDMIQT